MIEQRHRPPATRRIRNAYQDQVPTVVAGYVTTLIEGTKAAVDEMEVDFALRRIEDNFTIEHVPTVCEFEEAYLSKRVSPAEVKVDSSTDRVYLIGLGLPGREELIAKRMPVRDENGREVGSQTITDSVIREDTVLVYTEVSWQDYHHASVKAEDLPHPVQQGLAMYFQIPTAYLPGTLLATPSLSDEELYGIALNALQSS